MSGEEREGPPTVWMALGQYAGFGLAWALSTLLFMLAGFWLDGKLGTAPVLTILGAFVGGAAGFYSMYRHLVVEPRERGERRENDG